MTTPGRVLSIIAQDPSIRPGGRILRSRIQVPRETLAPGPCGYRVAVIDYDASTDTLYAPLDLGVDGDPFELASDDELLGNPKFHQQNVYAIAMCTLARFEFALGRRAAWSIRGHQIKIAPHAFCDPNAFYSESDEALMFGYFPSGNGAPVYSCLSHDVVVHETTHALVDGLRTRYTDASSPDQAAFHEGFADIVALLSVFAQESVMHALLPGQARDGGDGVEVSDEGLRRSRLFALAEQMGAELHGMPGRALRQSLGLVPSPSLIEQPEFREAHRRGELLVAVILNALVEVWNARITTLGADSVNRARLAEEGAEAADHLLTICIRALDFTPAVDLRFSDYLSAILTADAELFPEDDKYRFRDHIRSAFASFGVGPARTATRDGLWVRYAEQGRPPLRYDRNHVEPLQRDRNEMYRFLWENREALELAPQAYCEVISVRPCIRQGRDGFFLRETVAEYVEILRLRAGELDGVNLRAPVGVGRDQEIFLYGGGALIFDEFSQVKYHVKSRVHSARQQERLDYLAGNGFLRRDAGRRGFAEIHLERATSTTTRLPDGW